MKSPLSVLDNLSVAAPCSASWDRMRGDARVRFCGDCKLHVYNLSELTQDEAVELVRQAEGRLCVRFYRRGDGTVLTQNCPNGLGAIRRRMTPVLRRVAAVFGFALGGLASGGCMGAVAIKDPSREQKPTSQPTTHGPLSFDGDAERPGAAQLSESALDIMGS